MPWVDIAQAAFTLGVSERTIRNWIKSGKLNARTREGHREVEIPEADDEMADRFFNEEGEEPSSNQTQKRLEVALLECGRVKGTLASQERIMENLTANIAELNAKLQHKEAAIWRRTLLAVLIGFMAIIAYIMATWSGQHTLTTERGRLQDEYQTRLTNEQNQNKKDLKAANEHFITELNKQKDELKSEHAADIKDRMATINTMIDRLSNENEKIRKDLEETKNARLKAETQVDLYKHDLDLSTKKLAELEKEAELLRTRVKELEKTRRELEETEVHLRRKLMGDSDTD